MRKSKDTVLQGFFAAILIGLAFIAIQYIGVILGIFVALMWLFVTVSDFFEKLK